MLVGSRIECSELIKMWCSFRKPWWLNGNNVPHIMLVSWDERLVDNPLWIDPKENWRWMNIDFLWCPNCFIHSVLAVFLQMTCISKWTSNNGLSNCLHISVTWFQLYTKTLHYPEKLFPNVDNFLQCLVIQEVLVTPLARFSRLVKSFVDIQECYMISLWYIINLRYKKIWMPIGQPRAKQTNQILLITCMWEDNLKYGYTGNDANLK